MTPEDAAEDRVDEDVEDGAALRRDEAVETGSASSTAADALSLVDLRDDGAMLLQRSMCVGKVTVWEQGVARCICGGLRYLAVADDEWWSQKRR